MKRATRSKGCLVKREGERTPADAMQIPNTIEMLTNCKASQKNVSDMREAISALFGTAVP